MFNPFLGLEHKRKSLGKRGGDSREIKKNVRESTIKKQLSMKLQTVINFLDNLKGYNPELEHYFIRKSDDRAGRRCELAKREEQGSLTVKTELLTYNEMYMFLQGYMFKKNNYL
jgi:hypothetical protein